jgi:hypothetical protein
VRILRAIERDAVAMPLKFAWINGREATNCGPAFGKAFGDHGEATSKPTAIALSDGNQPAGSGQNNDQNSHGIHNGAPTGAFNLFYPSSENHEIHAVKNPHYAK